MRRQSTTEFGATKSCKTHRRRRMDARRRLAGVARQILLFPGEWHERSQHLESRTAGIGREIWAVVTKNGLSPWIGVEPLFAVGGVSRFSICFASHFCHVACSETR